MIVGGDSVAKGIGGLVEEQEVLVGRHWPHCEWKDESEKLSVQVIAQGRQGADARANS